VAIDALQKHKASFKICDQLGFWPIAYYCLEDSAAHFQKFLYSSTTFDPLYCLPRFGHFGSLFVLEQLLKSGVLNDLQKNMLVHFCCGENYRYTVERCTVLDVLNNYGCDFTWNWVDSPKTTETPVQELIRMDDAASLKYLVENNLVIFLGCFSNFLVGALSEELLEWCGILCSQKCGNYLSALFGIEPVVYGPRMGWDVYEEAPLDLIYPQPPEGEFANLGILSNNNA
jgi:hypothetical protein